MRRVERLGAALLIMVVMSGCASNRRWGPCALAGGLIGGVIGGVAAGVLVHEYEPTPKSEEIFWAGGASGMLGGMALGTVLGHYICDPEDDASAYSPSR
jgi:hypothetical protein